MQRDAVLLFDELADGSAAPEEELHLELFRAFVDDDAPNGVFLCRTSRIGALFLCLFQVAFGFFPDLLCAALFRWGK